MGKSTYTVPYVRRELLSLWHECWDSKPPTSRSTKANRDASLGQTAIVEAKNMGEAAQTVEAAHPGCVAIRSAISRMG